MGMAWLHSRRKVVLRGHLERAIAAVVKSQCEGFVDVLIERVKPQSRSAPNWTVRGIRFGKADREKSRKVVGTVVEEMQREFDLSDQDEAREPVPANGC
jgi:hypothetical protein